MFLVENIYVGIAAITFAFVAPAQSHSQCIMNHSMHTNNGCETTMCCPTIANQQATRTQNACVSEGCQVPGCSCGSVLGGCSPIAPATQFRTETRTRTIPVTRFVYEKVAENILCPDGRIVTQLKTVRRRVVEQQTQSYTVQVPYLSTVQQVSSETPDQRRDRLMNDILTKLKLILGEDSESYDDPSKKFEKAPSLKDLKEAIDDLDPLKTSLRSLYCPRVWTSACGKHATTSEVISLKKETVYLRKEDRGTCVVAIAKLSDSDRDHLKKLQTQLNAAMFFAAVASSWI